MASQYESYRDGSIDAKFIRNVRRVLGNITFMTSELMKRVEAFAQKENVGPTGLERRQYDYNSIQLKLGPSHMNYPNRTQFHVGAYRMIATWAALTYSIDQQVYLAYKEGKADSLVKLGEEMKMLAQGLGYLLDFYLATSDTTGRLATCSGVPTTTSVPLSTTWDGTPAKGIGAAMIFAEVDYEFVNPTTGAVGSNFRIAYDDRARINKTTNTIDFSGAYTLGAAPAAGDIIVPRGSAFNAPYGLPALIAGAKTGYWQGKNMAGSYEDQSMTIDAGTTQPIGVLMLERVHAKRRLRANTAEMMKFQILTALAERIEYIKSAYATINPFNVGGGRDYDPTVGKAKYNGEFFDEFVHIDADALYGVDLGDFIKLEEMPPGIISSDGLVWRQMRSSDNTQPDFGSGRWYTNYGTALNWMIGNPQNHFKISRLYVDPTAPTLANYLSTT